MKLRIETIQKVACYITNEQHELTNSPDPVFTLSELSKLWVDAALLAPFDNVSCNVGAKVTGAFPLLEFDLEVGSGGGGTNGCFLVATMAVCCY